MTVLSGGEEHIIVLEGRGTTTESMKKIPTPHIVRSRLPNPSADNVSFEVNSLT